MKGHPKPGSNSRCYSFDRGSHRRKFPALFDCGRTARMVLFSSNDVSALSLDMIAVTDAVDSYYLATSRELKRLDAVSRSPIFAWFSESLAGVSTIRAFNQQNVFITKNERRIDRNQICS